MLRAAVLLVAILLATGCSFLGGSGATWDRSSIVLDGTSAAILTLTNRSLTGTDWALATDASWLSVTPSGGTLAPYASTSVVISVDRAGRPAGAPQRLERSPGTYRARVTASTAAGDLPVEVTFTVHAEPSEDACAVQAADAPPPANVLGATDPDPEVRRPGAAPSPTHIIVKLRDDAPAGAQSTDGAGSRVADVAATYGLLDLRPGPGRGVRIARVPAGADPQALAERIAGDPRVAYAEPDRPLYPQAVLPDDPELARQWAPCRFGLPEAWSVSTGAVPNAVDPATTTIAVLDSGVDVDHPDLAARMLAGYDFCPVAGAGSGGCRSVPPEPGGETAGDPHGTHVAGIAAAIGDNGRGVAGVAWGGARILPVKVFDDFGQYTSESTVACGIYWAIGATDPAELCGAAPNPSPARILNLSLGGPGTSSTLNAAVAAAVARGAVVFAATGNGSSLASHGGIFMPANAPDAVAVGSVNSNFERSSFARFDVHGGPTVDLMAPGGFQLSDGDTVYSTFPNGGYGALGGTSMATPYVSGVAALVWASDPALAAEDVLARMRTTAYFAPGWTPEEYGAGVVCADAALGLATRCGTAP